MKQRRAQRHENHERWLVSYADFITLLFAFFVVLYASSQVDKKKMGQLATAIQHAFHEMGVFQGRSVAPIVDGDSEARLESAERLELARMIDESRPKPSMSHADLSGLQRELEAALAVEIRRQEVALQIGPEGLVISLREVGFFDSGSATLRPQTEEAFGKIAGLLLQYDCSVRVEGHTDNLPIHSAQFGSNWELSTARATEVIRKLIVQFGYSPERLSAAGYGEHHPVASNATEEGRRMNRRIDIVVLAPSRRNSQRDVSARDASRTQDKVPNFPSR